MAGFDLVVVGAGSAGAVIAARVTEDPKKRVLLIEAGPDYANEASLPEDLKDVRVNSVIDHDWGFVYQPSPLTRPDVPLPRGKVTGGSSAVNTAIALRGQPEDYDEWAALGCPEWSWEKCLPAFIRLEADQDFDNEWHGTDGPLPIRRHKPDELAPFQQSFLDACKAAGYPECPDHNHPTTTGYGPHPMNKRGDLRISTALAYLQSARERENLTIRPDTLVRRVVCPDGRVRGLEVETGGSYETITCERVVLCAGSIQTPPTLIRSGIGPRETLERLGITVVRDACGVGGHLLDHPAALVILAPKDGVVTGEEPMIQTTLRYTASRSDEFNDMQLEPLTFAQRLDNGPLFMGLAPVVEKAHGHGRLFFHSADPAAQPAIEPDFLQNEWDRVRLAEGVEIAWKMAHEPPISDLTAAVVRPRPEIAEDRERLLQTLPRATGSGYHPCGTAKMGPEDDEEAVVDQYGRVHGVEGLFVADASLMPTIPRANTNIPTIMIGERFGEWFREEAI